MSGAQEPGLDETQAEDDPLRLFTRWFTQAEAANLPQPEAMTLATCSLDGYPSARIVLLRGYDERGFTFFTNYESRKGRELTDNPRAALILFWSELKRQIRIEGTVQRVSDAESDEYFLSRPWGHRISAWASPQSQVVGGRELLETRTADLAAQFPEAVPRPPFWGGFRVVPTTIEFWQGRENRLHDRLRYRKVGSEWVARARSGAMIDLASGGASAPC